MNIVTLLQVNNIIKIFQERSAENQNAHALVTVWIHYQFIRSIFLLLSIDLRVHEITNIFIIIDYSVYPNETNTSLKQFSGSPLVPRILKRSHIYTSNNIQCNTFKSIDIVPRR